jgi:hypothetical protein
LGHPTRHDPTDARAMSNAPHFDIDGGWAFRGLFNLPVIWDAD